ncbi:MAG: hypothetical protein ACKVS6_17295 [Planctomycetota bacterium]
MRRPFAPFLAILLAAGVFCSVLACKPANGAGAGNSAGPASGTAPGSDANQNVKKTTALQFDSLGKELGLVPWPTGVDTQFTIKNPSKLKIDILQMLTSCGCTNPRLRIVKDGKTVRDGFAPGETLGPLLTIHPGEEGELRVRFETQTLTGSAKDHYSMITIVTSEKDIAPTQLFIRAVVERKYELSETHLSFAPMGSKQSATKEVKVFLLTPGAAAPFESKLVSAPKWVKIDIKEEMLGFRPYVSVQATAGPGLAQQINQSEIVIEGKFARPASEELLKVNIPIIVPVVGDIQMKPGLFDFQVVEAGVPVESKPVLLSYLDPDAKLQLGEAAIEGDGSSSLKLKIQTTAEREKYELTLVAENGFAQAYPAGAAGLVRLPSGFKDFPEIRIPYRAIFRNKK